MLHHGLVSVAAWEALGSMIGGVFTALGFLAAAVVLQRDRQERRALELEKWRESRDRQARVARLVYALPDEHDRQALVVTNASNEPIFGVQVGSRHLRVAGRFVVVKNSNGLSPPHQLEGLSKLDPHSTAVIDLGDWPWWDAQWGARPAAPEIVFLDSDGRYWVRCAWDQPQQIVFEGLPSLARGRHPLGRLEDAVVGLWWKLKRAPDELPDEYFMFGATPKHEDDSPKPA
jgi:hypothetical protein